MHSQGKSVIRRLSLPIAASLLVGACASSAPVPGSVTRSLPMGTRGSSQGGVGLEVTARNDGQTVNLAASPAAVYEALVASYAAIGIPLTRQDPAGMVIGNDGIKLRRQLGKIEMRKAFDCGGTPGMPNSETYQITATIISSVRPDASSGASVTTVIDASASNPSYPASGVRCGSAGAIESAIVKEVRERLNSR